MNSQYDVVVWYKLNRSQADLPSQIIARVGREPDEAFEAEVFGDLHWNFETSKAAIKSAESLFEFAALDDVVRLVVNNYGDEDFERKVYKDTTGIPAAGKMD